MRKFFEKIVEGGLLISGSVSSFTILLIVFFLFKEAGGLFNTPATEEGYVLAVNKSNDVGKLSPEKIMDIFDGNITNWKDVSGIDQDILIFRFSDLTNYYAEEELGDEFQYVPQKISELVAKEPGIIAFFPKQYLLENGFQGKVLPEEKITLGEFFGGTKWYPTSTPAPIFGLIPLLLGTLLVSIGAIVLSLPFGIAVAIYMAEIATDTRPLETDHRTTRRHSVCRLRFLRFGGDRSAHPEDIRPACRRNGFCRQRGIGDYGTPYDHHRCGGCHADNTPCHERGKPRLRRYPMADDLQSNHPVLHFRYYIRSRAGHRTCDRRNDGRPDGNRQCGRHPDLLLRAGADHSCNDRCRIGGSSRRRRTL